MKKILALSFIAMGILMSCSNSPKKVEDKSTDNSTQVADKHNAQNSLDYKGTYKGTLPCADCPGIETVIVLGDNDYTKTTTYQERNEKPFEEKGTYTWDATGTIITLSGSTDGPNKYFVGENFIKQLDMDGKEITGDLAKNYILKKQ